MRIKKYLYLIILSFFININHSYSAFQSKIIVNVDDQIVTSYELKNKIRTNLILNNENMTQANIDKLKNTSLKSLINYKLKKREVIKANLLNDELDTSDFIKRISKNYANNLKEFKNIFKINNLSYDLYEEEIKVELAWQQLILGIYGKKVSVDENEVDEELKRIIDNKKNLIEFRLSEIEIQITDNKNTNDLVKEIQNQIDNEGFENTAIKYSVSLTAMEGGNLGWINAEALSNNILNIVNNLNLEEVSEPIFQNETILFIKLNEIKKLDINKIDIVKTKNKIINQKKNEILDLFSRSHLSKIRNKASIEVK